MRIRGRQQGQSLSALLPSDLPALLPSDLPAPQPPPNAPPRDRHLELHAGDKREELHPDAATTADLRDEPSLAARRAALLPLLPQNNVVECSKGLGAAADGQRSLENGHHRMSEPAVIEARERLPNGVSPAMPATATVQKEEIIKDDGGGGASGGGGIKKRCGPSVLLEGSRCSRVNGRGWRCSQPTLVGYSLCEHHLGKGRMRSAAGAAARAAAGQKLGRTEHKKERAHCRGGRVHPATQDRRAAAERAALLGARGWLRSIGPQDSSTL